MSGINYIDMVCPVCGGKEHLLGMKKPDSGAYDDVIVCEYCDMKAQLRGIKPTDQLPEIGEIVEVLIKGKDLPIDGILTAYHKWRVWGGEYSFDSVRLWRRRIPFLEAEK